MSRNPDQVPQNNNAQSQYVEPWESGVLAFKNIITTKNQTLVNQNHQFPQGSFQFANNYFLEFQKNVTQTDEQSDLQLSFSQPLKFQHQEVLIQSLNKYINQTEFKYISEEFHQVLTQNLRQQTKQFQNQCMQKIKKDCQVQDFSKIGMMMTTVHHRREYIKLMNCILEFIPLSLAKSLLFIVRQLYIFAQFCIIKLRQKLNKIIKNQIQLYLRQNLESLVGKLATISYVQQLFPQNNKQSLHASFEQFVEIWGYSFCMFLEGFYENKYYGDVPKEEGNSHMFHFSDDNFWGQPERKTKKKVKKNQQ